MTRPSQQSHSLQESEVRLLHWSLPTFRSKTKVRPEFTQRTEYNMWRDWHSDDGVILVLCVCVQEMPVPGLFAVQRIICLAHLIWPSSLKCHWLLSLNPLPRCHKTRWITKTPQSPTTFSFHFLIPVWFCHFRSLSLACLPSNVFKQFNSLTVL